MTMEIQTSVTRAGSRSDSSPSAANVWGSSLRHGCGSKLKSGGGSSRTTPVDHPCFRCAWQVRETALESSTPKEAEVDHVPVGPNSQTLRISLVPGPGARSSLPVLDSEISLFWPLLGLQSHSRSGLACHLVLCLALLPGGKREALLCLCCISSVFLVCAPAPAPARAPLRCVASIVFRFHSCLFFPFVFFLSFFSLLFTLSTSSNPLPCPVSCSVSSLDFWGSVGETFESRRTNYTLDDG